MQVDALETEESLVGFTVGITADRRWEEQAELLRRRGALILHGPTIRTLPLGSTDELFEVTQRLIRRPPTMVVANTGIGIRAWLSAAESWGLGDALLGALAPAKIFARGPKASAAVHQSGLDVAARSPSERMAELLDIMMTEDLTHALIAFQCHGDESPEAIARLRDAGAEVIEVPIYRWILPQDTTAAETLIRATIERTIHAITFTSAPAVRNLLIIAQELENGGALIEALNTDVIPSTVGPVCEAAARQVGITCPVTPAKWRLGPMIRTLSESLRATQQHTTLAGIPVALSGSTVLIDGAAIGLSRREVDVLRALLRRSPGFVTKRDLHQRIWGGAGDDHVVEVTIGRLRRKLGPPGSGVVSVPRRGYAVQA
jgi:uroporphyrinogen-III synthase